MKMNAKLLTQKVLAPVALLTAFGLGTLAPHAQTNATKVGFVNVKTLFAAYPTSKDVDTLQAAAQKELGDLQTQMQAIQAKGAAATAADKTKFQQLSDTYNAKMKDYDTQINAKAAPMEKAVDTAIGNYAKANGFAIIMDRAAAQGLVVYADDATDVTEAIKKNVK